MSSKLLISKLVFAIHLSATVSLGLKVTGAGIDCSVTNFAQFFRLLMGVPGSGFVMTVVSGQNKNAKFVFISKTNQKNRPGFSTGRFGGKMTCLRFTPADCHQFGGTETNQRKRCGFWSRSHRKIVNGKWAARRIVI